MAQDWYKQINSMLRPRNYEMVRGDTMNLFIGPQHLSAEEKRNIVSLLPEDMKDKETRFEVGVKSQTVTNLSFILKNIGPHHVELEGPREAKILIGIDAPVEQVDAGAKIWQDINDILFKDGFLRKWSVYIRSDKLYAFNAEVVRAVQKRGDVREAIISDDDVLNLKIALESAQDVNDFLEAL